MQKMVVMILLVVAGITKIQAQSIPAQLLWDYSTGGPVQVVAPFPDVNGDGRPDLLAGSGDSLVYCLSGGGPEYAREIWSYKAMGGITDVETLGDVNADGFPDAVAGSRDNHVYCISGKPSEEGLELWAREDSASIWSVAALGDVSGDGISDLVVGSAMNNLICISGSARQQGQILWQFSSDADFWNVIALSDVNNDGKPDCAGSCDNFIYCFSGAGQGQQGSNTAKSIWSTPYDAGSRVWALAAIPDVNADGKQDILLGSNMDRVECLSGATGRNIWSFGTGADAVCVAPIGDLNGDGKTDVLAGSADDYAYALSGATGQQLWKVKCGSTVLSAVSASDINSDGYPEAVFGSDADEVICVSGGGATKGQKIWSYTATGGIRSVAAVGDVNLNGITDVAAASTDSYVRLFEGNSRILDVELVSFTASVQSNGIQLAWRTATETNNLGFEVQRSWDGRVFEPIGFVPGNGTSAEQHDYTFVDGETGWEILYYRLKQIDRDGQYHLFAAMKVVQQRPERLTLYGSYPNPFNAGTFIVYDLPAAGEVIVRIFNLRGEMVRELCHGRQPAGSHSLHWDGSLESGEQAASGIYFCSISAGGEIGRLRISYLK
jgi:outer membrane protein assembly factor BamB